MKAIKSVILAATSNSSTVPYPFPGPNTVRIKVQHVEFCHSDAMVKEKAVARPPVIRAPRT